MKNKTFGTCSLSIIKIIDTQVARRGRQYHSQPSYKKQKLVPTPHPTRPSYKRQKLVPTPHPSRPGYKRQKLVSHPLPTPPPTKSKIVLQKKNLLQNAKIRRAKMNK